MNSAERVQLSKLMSYLLRHRPDEAGLTLDENGLVPLSALLAAIRLRSGYTWVTAEDIREVMATSDKQRFRLVGVTGCRTLATRNGGVRQPVRDCIGARYGHSQWQVLTCHRCECRARENLPTREAGRSWYTGRAARASVSRHRSPCCPRHPGHGPATAWAAVRSPLHYAR